MTVYSREIILDTAPSADQQSRVLRLVEITEGQIIDGSSTRWQEHRWGVRFDEDGAVHGRQFRTLEAARANFDEHKQVEAEPITIADLDDSFDE